jgi:L-amino acid N-acyltransferase YncA
MSHRIRRFTAADQTAMIAFAQQLPEHDLLFLGRDLKHPRVVSAWIDAIDQGYVNGLVAEEDGTLVGTAALVCDPLGWSAHVGEVRLLVTPTRRGAGVGRDLLEGIYVIARERGLSKLIANMTPDQIGSVMLFESLGFRAEALLRDQVRDSNGTPHDLAIMSADIAQDGDRAA